jgi:hypothetical protein
VFNRTSQLAQITARHQPDPAFGSLYCFGSGFDCIGGTASSKPLRLL